MQYHAAAARDFLQLFRGLSVCLERSSPTELPDEYLREDWQKLSDDDSANWIGIFLAYCDSAATYWLSACLHDIRSRHLLVDLWIGEACDAWGTECVNIRLCWRSMLRCAVLDQLLFNTEKR